MCDANAKGERFGVQKFKILMGLQISASRPCRLGIFFLGAPASKQIERDTPPTNGNGVSTNKNRSSASRLISVGCHLF